MCYDHNNSISKCIFGRCLAMYTSASFLFVVFLMHIQPSNFITTFEENYIEISIHKSTLRSSFHYLRVRTSENSQHFGDLTVQIWKRIIGTRIRKRNNYIYCGFCKNDIRSKVLLFHLILKLS